jgi:hypothetical protein
MSAKCRLYQPEKQKTYQPDKKPDFEKMWSVLRKNIKGIMVNAYNKYPKKFMEELHIVLNKMQEIERRLENENM